MSCTVKGEAPFQWVVEWLNCDLLLGTKEGIAALSEFLKKTSAFTRSSSISATAPPPIYENESEQPAEAGPRLEFNDGG